jgi:hypothetical protein
VYLFGIVKVSIDVEGRKPMFFAFVRTAAALFFNSKVLNDFIYVVFIIQDQPGNPGI